MAKQRVLVSACLVGKNCKYNGANNYNPAILSFLEDKEVFLICPEVMGGLPTPRLKSEIKESNGSFKVINEQNEDVTSFFENGAEKALKIALENKVDFAILKEKSPSCGSQKIYNGNFNGTLVDGNGIFAKKLKEHSIKILTEEDFNGGNNDEN